MRLVEMLNGDVYLMNGEAQLRRFKCLNPGARAGAAELAAVMVAPKFDYAAVYDKAAKQYESPKGVYQSLVRAEPVAMAGVPASAAEPERMYLVGKHGTIWTFAEDFRYHVRGGRAAPEGEPHEPPPGVRRHFVLVAVHDRRQANCIRLQRSAAGQVEGVIDDYERVTQIVHRINRPASADRWVDRIKDFAGREIDVVHTSLPDFACDERDLKAVSGPGITNKLGGQPEKPYLQYNYLRLTSGGPTHRLGAVFDPSGAGLMGVRKWDDHGRIETQSVLGKYQYELRHNGTTVKYKERYSGYDITGQRKQLADDHEYVVKRAATTGRDFDEVTDHTVQVKRRSRLGGFSGPARTSMKHNDHGELVLLVLPKRNKQVFTYVESGSQMGNPEVTEDPSSTARTAVTAYDARFNFQKKVVQRGSVHGQDREAILTTFWYGHQGNLEGTIAPTVKTDHHDTTGNPKSRTPSAAGKEGQGGTGDSGSQAAPKKDPHNKTSDIISHTYRKEDGLLETTTDRRGAVTRYFYYAPDEGEREPGIRRAGSPKPRPHVPGDAWDCVGMLAMTQVVADGDAPRATPKKPIRSRWPDMVRSNMPVRSVTARYVRRNLCIGPRLYPYPKGMVSVFVPNTLGHTEMTFDPDMTREKRDLNEVGLVLKDANGVLYEYLFDYVRSKKTPIPGKASKYSETVTDYDALGNLVSTRTAESGADTQYDGHGNPVRERDTDGNETIYVYDERGLLLRKAVTEARAAGADKEAATAKV